MNLLPGSEAGKTSPPNTPCHCWLRERWHHLAPPQDAAGHGSDPDPTQPNPGPPLGAENSGRRQTFPTPPTGPVTTPAGEWQQRQGQSEEEEARWNPVTKGQAVSSWEPFPGRCEGTEPCISWDSKPPAHALCPICLHLENTNSKRKLLRISSRILLIRNSFLIWHKSLSAKITWTGLKISF